MQVFSINNFHTQKINSNPSFQGGGKPITLQYIVEKRSHLLPQRVLEAAQNELKKCGNSAKSLLDLHKELYAPLLACSSLEEVKKIFPEFSEIKNSVEFERDSHYAALFKERTGNDFVLRVLKDYWANLKTKNEIAQSFGMKDRKSMDWALKKIGFVSYNTNYKTLLKSSDERGNKEIAAKTTAWNALHPDLMYKHNKQAAQGCKTEEYRKAQSERIKKHYINHPEKREQVSALNKEAWSRCPEVRVAMGEFMKQQSKFFKSAIIKRFQGEKLTDFESRITKGFFKKFWDAHPELKNVFAESKRKK